MSATLAAPRTIECRACGATFEHQQCGQGRPPAYCSDECRPWKLAPTLRPAFDIRKGQFAPNEQDTAEYERHLRHDPCAYCGSPADALDHIEPRYTGGADESSNLTAACGPCNSAKRSRSLLRFLGARTARQALRLAWRSYAAWTGASETPPLDHITGNLRQMFDGGSFEGTFSDSLRPGARGKMLPFQGAVGKAALVQGG